MKTNQRVRLALTVTGATLSAFVFTASPAFADYRAWYAPGDDVGDFEEGDVSEDNTKLIPPAGACGFKIDSPNTYTWISSNGAIVQDDEGYNEEGDIDGDAIIWLEDGPGCSHEEITTVMNGVQTIDLPENGALYLEIHGSDSGHWVDDVGCKLSGCGGGYDAPDLDIYGGPKKYWFSSVISSFKAVTPSIVDPNRQPRAVAAIATLSNDVVELQVLLQEQIAARRRSPLGVLEASVHSLEDAATQALTAARSSVAACERQARQRTYSDAFVACTTAGQWIEHSAALIQTATSLPR